MPHILVIEDEKHLAIGLKFNFEAEGYTVSTASDGPHAMEIMQGDGEPVDLVILDLMLPGISGYDICEQIRRQKPDLPILVLSARTLSEDKARAFDSGSDQYMTKPFDLHELLSRVRNLLERRQPVRDLYEFGRARVDFRTFEVTVDGEPRNLTQMEMQLLRLFLEHEGVVLSRAEILDKVWDLRPAPTTRTVDNFVMRLRKHFEKDPAQPLHFVSVRAAGYRFNAQDKS